MTFNLHNVLKLLADAAKSHFTAEFTDLLTEHRIKDTFTSAPDSRFERLHSRWMVHAYVPGEFFDFVFEHAWKVFNCLTIRDLQLDGKLCTPLESYTADRKPHLARFRVLFCPCVIDMGEANQVVVLLFDATTVLKEAYEASMSGSLGAKKVGYIISLPPVVFGSVWTSHLTITFTRRLPTASLQTTLVFQDRTGACLSP